jgi:hypothetical protein
MYPAIVQVKPLDDYHIVLSFANGEVRRFDMKPFLETGLFVQLKERKLFDSVKVSFDTIEWNNQLDFDPEILYEKSTPVE